jgi:Phospholipase_D-nuclease N-terminal
MASLSPMARSVLVGVSLMLIFFVVRNIVGEQMSATSKKVWSMIVILVPVFGIVLWRSFPSWRRGGTPLFRV